MRMLCNACPKVALILILKVVSKTEKNKFKIEESIGSLIGTRTF
jgi:hypothetical protein